VCLRDRQIGNRRSDRGHIAGTVVGVLVSPPPDTAAVLVTLAGALLATFTVSVIAG
jgi:hypothetical protein